MSKSDKKTGKKLFAADRSADKLRLLYVDADRAAFEAAARQFDEEEDVAMEHTTTAGAALDRLDSDIDCIVSEYDLPETSGISLLKAVRENSPAMPFILFTAHGDEHVASRAISAGVTEYLPKKGRTDQYELLAKRVRESVTRNWKQRLLDQQQLFVQLSQPAVELEYQANEPIVRRVNPAFEETFGYGAEEILDESLDSYIVPPRKESRAKAINERVQETGELVAEEVTRQTANGKRHFLLQNAVFDGGSRAFAVYTDITERKKQQRELHRLSETVAKAHSPLSLADATQKDTPLVYVNEAFEELTGYSRHEVTGRNCRLLQGPETESATVDRLRQAITNEERVTVEIRNYRKDGTMFWNELTIEPVYDADGRLVRYLGTQRDITERREREQQLAVLDRVLRHNLRNDLSVIKGLASLIHDETTGEISTRAESITSKSDQLLASAEKQREIMTVLLGEPSYMRVDMHILAQRIASRVNENYPQATIEVNCPTGIIAIGTDRLEVAIQELVRNAIQHNDQKNPFVKLTVRRNYECVIVEVVDTGPRIPEMEREVGTSGAELSSLYHGSGLGLWLVYWIVTRSNGTISFESNSPRGNRVQVELPHNTVV